jgi:hypothetical protein
VYIVDVSFLVILFNMSGKELLNEVKKEQEM